MRLSHLILSTIILLVLSANAGYFEEPEKYERTGKHYTQLAPSTSDHISEPGWLFDLAWSYHEVGMEEKALDYLRRAIELNPEPKMAFLNKSMADVFRQMGSEDSAAYYYEQALELHYDYLEAWNELVKLRREYYANLGLLYAEKGEEHDDAILISTARDYLSRYIEEFPDGEHADHCRTTISRLDLLERQAASRENLRSQLQAAQEAEAERQASIEEERRKFRTEKLFLVGLGFYSVSMADDHDFIATFPDSVIDDTLSMKYYAANLNEFAVAGGYILGPVFLRGSIHFGTTSSGKNYFLKDPVPFEYAWDIDSSVTPWDSTKIDSTTRTDDDIRPEVSSINTLRFSFAADYNFFFMSPVLLYGGVHGDFGTATLKTSHTNYSYNKFESITLAGAGIGGGVMFTFSDFLLDLSYRRGLVGSSAGGTIMLSGIYKF